MSDSTPLSPPIFAANDLVRLNLFGENGGMRFSAWGFWGFIQSVDCIKP